MYTPPRVDGIKTVGVVSAIDMIGPVFSYVAPASAAYPLANTIT